MEHYTNEITPVVDLFEHLCVMLQCIKLIYLALGLWHCSRLVLQLLLCIHQDMGCLSCQ